MKRFLAFCLAAVLALGLLGCAAAGVSPEAEEETEADPLPVEEGPSPAPVPATEPPVTEPPVYDGELFLTVSEIVFTLQGESEDVYAGTIPREAVLWESEDESVAVFQDGVLTATGVGRTTVSATYREQRLECAVGCLAQSREDLAGISPELLHSPKRLPPETDETATAFFSDAAIIGDSISWVLLQYETLSGELGHPQFLVRGGSSLNGYVKYYYNLFYQGKETKLEDAVALSGVKKGFFMLGQNDLTQSMEDVMDNWALLLSRLRETCPDTDIYIESCFPIWRDDAANNERNEKILLYNELLIQFAEENGCYYVDIYPYLEDHTSRLVNSYRMDDYHLNETGCHIWMQALNAYAYTQIIGGTAA